MQAIILYRFCFIFADIRATFYIELTTRQYMTASAVVTLSHKGPYSFGDCDSHFVH